MEKSDMLHQTHLVRRGSVYYFRRAVPTDLIEYIIVHEMVHLLERNHNDRFRDLLDRFMPLWRSHRGGTESYPLES